MYVYSDIVEISPVSNSQVPIMSILPIKSNYQENGHWLFNPFLYVKVREKISDLSQLKFTPKLVKNFQFTTMWSFFDSTFAADDFWFRYI